MRCALPNHEPAWGTYAPRGILAVGTRIPGNTKLTRSIKKTILNRFGRADGLIDITHNGMRFRCHVRDNATDKNIAISGDRAGGVKLAALLGHLPPGGRFVDLGANCGLFALAAARKTGSAGQVVAVEPSPEMLRRLRFNVTANNLSHVTIVPAAVGESAGTANLSFHPDRRGSASLVTSQDHSIAVSVMTLMQVAASAAMERIDALKIDIEGYEDRALIPFLRTAPTSLWPSAILMEIKLAKRWREDCIAALIAAGYRMALGTRKDALLVR